MRYNITRRAIITRGLVAGAAFFPIGAIRNTASAASNLPALDPKDPAAVTLGFVNDSSKVDAAANPTHTLAQTCANCEQFQGKTGEALGGCVLFPGKLVPAAGWCKVWRKIP